MSIKKKGGDFGLEQKFIRKIENNLFDIIDTDDPIHTYMHIDICKVLTKNDIKVPTGKPYTSGEYHLKELSCGDFEKTLKVTEALYQTCLRFEKPELALIVSAEVTRALLQFELPLHWVDGKFIDKAIVN